MSYLFTSESVSEGHPDKIADRISDAIVDQFMAYDPNAKVACETMVTTGQVIIAGEIHSDAYVDFQAVARKVIRDIGYTKSEYNFDADSCGILSAIHEQSSDIRQGVEREEKEEQGAGDQGIMFGYASNETKEYMPLALDLSHRILRELSYLRKDGTEIPYLRPDSKSQVTIKYDDENQPKSIDTVVISTQHDPMLGDVALTPEKIKEDILKYLIPRVKAKCSEAVRELFTDEIKYLINPTGKFVIGGPHGDTGLTGRKIIVDTYGGKGAHGGGAFSGKDSSKVDRSAAYAMRHIAKNLVAAGVCDEVLIQVSYAIGVAEPCGLFVNTYGSNNTDLSDSDIADRLLENLDLRPRAIDKQLNLRKPIYEETATYGHMGRRSKTIKKSFNKGKENEKTLELELFTWEKLDYVNRFKEMFQLND